ncbi:MAG: polysaccharide deacetylase family protein [Bacteroidota bacterium]
MKRRNFVKSMGAGMVAAHISLGVVLAGRAFSMPGKQKHIITLSFDDGFAKSSIKTAEIYEKYGLSSCMNIIASAHQKKMGETDAYHKWPVGDFSLWNDLKKRGHEIMPHSYRHANLTQMSLEEAQGLVQKCIDLFDNELKGFKAEESVFNLPYNASTPELEEWLKLRFRAIRTHGDPVNPLPHKGLFRLGCTSYGPDNIDAHLDNTINKFLEGPSGWLIYNTHGLDDEGWGPVSSGFLDELLDRLNCMNDVHLLPVIPSLDAI